MSPTSAEVISAVPLSAVYRLLGGRDVKRAASDTWRAPAFWRKGDGLSVAGDDRRGCWYDHQAGHGGGLLDLIVAVRGRTRQDALRWLAEQVGIPIDETPLSREQRAAWAARRREIERELPRARLWRRATVLLVGELIDQLKTGLASPNPEDRWRPEIGELRHLAALLRHCRGLEDAALVAEYSEWRKEHPGWCCALIRAAAARERADRAVVRALVRVVAAA